MSGNTEVLFVVDWWVVDGVNNESTSLSDGTEPITEVHVQNSLSSYDRAHEERFR